MVRLSENAALMLNQLRESQNRPGAALRVAVLSGDCAGLNYFIGLDEFRAADDIAIESRGQRIHIDQTSAPYLWGSTLDWIETGGDAGFVVFNPNKGRGKSGCGSDGKGGGCMTKGDGNSCQKSDSGGGCGCSGGGGCGSGTEPVRIGAPASPLT